MEIGEGGGEYRCDSWQVQAGEGGFILQEAQEQKQGEGAGIELSFRNSVGVAEMGNIVMGQEQCQGARSSNRVRVHVSGREYCLY